MSAMKTTVLQHFKMLHRTRMKVFDGDKRALNAARLKINEEFNKNKHVTDQGAIKAMIQFAEDVDKELRTRVIQAKEVKPGVYEIKITDDTLKLENIPFNNDSILGDVAHQIQCCKDQAKKT